MRLSATGKLWTIAGTVILAATVVIWINLHLLDRVATLPANNQNDSTRETYAQVYDATWRSDEKNDSLLMTATLMTPLLKSALEVAIERSEVENQIWRAVDGLPDTSVAVIVTVDSVTGAVPDATLENSLNLAADPEHVFTKTEWIPIIAPSRVVNAPTTTTSQMGVAIFSSDTALDWTNTKLVQLDAKGIGSVPTRTFTWTQATWVEAE